MAIGMGALILLLDSSYFYYRPILIFMMEFLG